MFLSDLFAREREDAIIIITTIIIVIIIMIMMMIMIIIVVVVVVIIIIIVVAVIIVVVEVSILARSFAEKWIVALPFRSMSSTFDKLQRYIAIPFWIS